VPFFKKKNIVISKRSFGYGVQ